MNIADIAQGELRHVCVDDYEMGVVVTCAFIGNTCINIASNRTFYMQL